jgi:hypothetical protein
VGEIMIFNPKIVSTQNKVTKPSKRIAAGQKFKSDKRKRKIDRRSGVRDGVIVNLSSEYNRRKGFDRRKLQA